jgi:hypothetical protein
MVLKCGKIDDVTTHDCPGERLIISHVGGSMGLSQVYKLISKGKSTLDSYHHKINPVIYNIHNPHCSNGHVPYHSVQINIALTFSSRQIEMQEQKLA